MITAIDEQKFVQEFIDNEDFRVRVSQITEPSDLVALAAELDITLSKDDAKEVLEKAQNMYEDSELSDDALDMVSGGLLLSLSACIIIGCIAGVVGGVSAAVLRYRLRQMSGKC